MNLTSSSSVCLVSGDYSINHVDHLAVVAYLLDAPLLCDSEFLKEVIQSTYPQVKPLYISFHQDLLHYLGTHHERIFYSIAPYRKNLSPLLEVLYEKKMEFWYSPHGNSDKTLEHYALQDHALIYGEQMENRLQEEGLAKGLKRVAKIGDARRLFYLHFKDFYDNLVERDVFSRFAAKQPTYLYAPTWEDFEFSSSLFDASHPLLETLPSGVNLVVKMHPWLEHHHPGFVKHLEEKYQERSNIVILSNYSLVLPLLEKTDVYIGDFSSIGYDFLWYDRPMFFIDPKKRVSKRKNDSLLHACGKVISEDSYAHPFDFIENERDKQKNLTERRKELYSYAFGKGHSLEEIKHALQATFQVSKVTDQK